jgi:hypothetical protein
MTARYRIIECEQGSPEWFEARRGIPTASRYADVLAEGKGIMRARYMRQLAAETITEEPMETYKNAKMERGKEHEPDLRARYAFDHDINIEQVGFLRSNMIATGCSPDGLVGVDGMIEIKSSEPDLLIELLDSGRAPTQHMAQIQGNLWITGREWCDLVIGWPKLPLFTVRVKRDEPYMANLRRELERFNQELHEMVGRIKAKQ